jgi:hypothetical protein
MRRFSSIPPPQRQWSFLLFLIITRFSFVAGPSLWDQSNCLMKSLMKDRVRPYDFHSFYHGDTDQLAVTRPRIPQPPIGTEAGSPQWKDTPTRIPGHKIRLNLIPGENPNPSMHSRDTTDHGRPQFLRHIPQKSTILTLETRRAAERPGPTPADVTRQS